MKRPSTAAALGCASLLAAAVPARAHVVAGARVFPVTLTFDDPGVSDEVSLPAFSEQRGGADGGTGPSHEFDFGFEYDKTITPDTALIFNDGYDVIQTNGSKTQTGFENIFITGKWQLYTNDPHEFVVSLGIIRELGGSGTDHIGADHYGSTAPTAYFGKGLGDVPIPALRPFAVTGELGYTIADRELKGFTPPVVGLGGAGGPGGGEAASSGIAAEFKTGNNNAWAGAASLQYSVPYLQTQVHRYDMPRPFDNLIPLVEVTWTSPASSPSTQGTTWTVAPGVIYLAQWGEIGVEALIPVNKAAGTNVGAVALFHIFLDDLLPHSLGKPIFQ